jgi:hypothetical protein
MTSFINQTIARQQIADLISEAEQGRLRRELRKSRRGARAARRSRRGGPSNSTLYAPGRIGLAVAR